MDPIVKTFLDKHRIAVVSVTLDDGTVHAATIHYSFTENPFKFYMQTANTTLKAQPLLNGQTKKAAMVIGFSEEEWLTLQLHGNVRAVLDAAELEEVYKIHYAKQPQAEQHKGPNTLFVEFTPTWWRYTDFNTKPTTRINS